MAYNAFLGIEEDENETEKQQQCSHFTYKCLLCPHSDMLLLLSKQKILCKYIYTYRKQFP